jgi:hypothetical protein
MQHVEVFALVAKLDGNPSIISKVVFNKQVNVLPLSGRSFFDLLFVTSAAIQPGGASSPTSALARFLGMLLRLLALEVRQMDTRSMEPVSWILGITLLPLTTPSIRSRS